MFLNFEILTNVWMAGEKTSKIFHMCTSQRRESSSPCIPVLSQFVPCCRKRCNESNSWEYFPDCCGASMDYLPSIGDSLPMFGPVSAPWGCATGPQPEEHLGVAWTASGSEWSWQKQWPQECSVLWPILLQETRWGDDGPAKLLQLTWH